MVLHLLFLLLLLFASTTATIDSSSENSCYGSPLSCDPNRDCDSLLQFDANGNINLHLRNSTDSYGYAAFSVNHHPDETSDYLFCVPHQNIVFRALAEVGGSVLEVDKNVTSSVNKLDNFYFFCVFDITEFTVKFQHRQSFFVPKSSYISDLTVDNEYPLYNLNDNQNYDDDDFEEVVIVPSIYYIGYPSLQRSILKVTTDGLSVTENAENMSNDVTPDSQMENSARIKRDLWKGINYDANAYLQYSQENAIITDSTQYENFYDDFKMRHKNQKGLHLRTNENSLVPRSLESGLKAEENAKIDNQRNPNDATVRLDLNKGYTDYNGYAAFSVNRHPDETGDYFFCVPHQKTVFRALVAVEGSVLEVNQNVTKCVDEYMDDDILDKTLRPKHREIKHAIDTNGDADDYVYREGQQANSGESGRNGISWLLWAIGALAIINAAEEDEETIERRNRYAAANRRLSSGGFEIATNAPPLSPTSSASSTTASSPSSSPRSETPSPPSTPTSPWSIGSSARISACSTPEYVVLDETEATTSISANHSSPTAKISADVADKPHTSNETDTSPPVSPPLLLDSYEGQGELFTISTPTTNTPLKRKAMDDVPASTPKKNGRKL